MEVKNLTITLPAEVGRKARILAAEADTSMSQFICRLVIEKIENETEYELARKRFFSFQARPLQTEASPYPDRNSLHDRNAFR